MINGPFNTVPAAPSALTAPTATITDSQITLTWTDNSRHEDYFRVFRKAPGETTFTNITNVGAVSGVGNTVSFTDTGLAFNSTYEYYVEAHNGAGDSGDTNHVTPTTNAAITPPAAPGYLYGYTYPTPTSIEVYFGDGSTNEDSFIVEQKSESDANFAIVSAIPSTSVKNYRNAVFLHNRDAEPGYRVFVPRQSEKQHWRQRLYL